MDQQVVPYFALKLWLEKSKVCPHSRSCIHFSQTMLVKWQFEDFQGFAEDEEIPAVSPVQKIRMRKYPIPESKFSKSVTITTPFPNFQS